MKMKLKYILSFAWPFLLSLTVSAGNGTLSFDATRIAVEKGGFTCSPQGVQVVLTIDLSALKLPATRRVVLTPVVKNREEARHLPPVVVNGRRKHIDYLRGHTELENHPATVVRRKNGKAQTVRYTASLPYEPWMENADVTLLQDVCGCGDLMDSDRLTLWRRRHPKVAYIRPEAGVQTYTLEGSAHIDFPVDETTLYPDYGRNPEELLKVLQTIEQVKQDNRVTITGIAICGWASPESPYPHNASLAEGRAHALQRYVAGLLHLDDALFTVSFVPENWSGLRAMVEASALPAKADVLRIVDDDTLAPDVKEARIKAGFPQDYAFMLARFYPDLRRSDYTVTYTVRPYTVDEAMALWKQDPRRLSLEALYLVAAQYEPGSPAFDELFATAVSLFPADTVANLNAACAAIERGDFPAAEGYLSRAGDTPQAWNARGVVAARQGDLERAAAWFSRAASNGLDVARGNLQLVGGRY
ncbi:MAG: tetratricopeptide repeat protein [Prevotellaceae bacterium]|nr:tetratricopeptide repeat protein [Prevotellaceae bacterium]